MYLFTQVCFKVVFSPSWEFFPHMDTSPLPMKGSRCRPMLDVYGHISYKVPSRVHTYCDTEHPFFGQIRGLVTYHFACLSFPQHNLFFSTLLCIFLSTLTKPARHTYPDNLRSVWILVQNIPQLP